MVFYMESGCTCKQTVVAPVLIITLLLTIGDMSKLSHGNV